MTVALPLPYDDELLYNVIGRYIDDACVETPSKAIRILFGRIVHPSAEVLYDLSEFADQTYDSWGLSATQIVQQLTLLPYYASCAPEALRKVAFDCATRPASARPALVLGVHTNLVIGPSTFRFCAQCAAEDIEQFGESYWRRSHQLPGVFICVRHSTPLRTSNAHVRILSSKHWHAGHDEIASNPHAPISAPQHWLQNADLLEVMRKSTALLADGPRPSDSITKEAYFSRAENAGLVKHYGHIDVDAIRVQMTAMYGKDYLDAVGLSIPPAPKQAWPFRMMQRGGSVFQPLQHVLLDHFLERCDEMARARAFCPMTRMNADRRLTCPNRYATHEVGHILEHVRIEELPDDSSIGRASCSCGLKFSFTRCRPSTNEPEISRIYALGKDWRDAAKQMQQSGLSRAEIARSMGVSYSTVKVLLKNRSTRKTQPSRDDVLEWRHEWLELLATIAHAGHKKASMLNRRLYYLLNTYDTDWLRKSAAKCMQARDASDPGRAVNWASRDEKLCVELRLAATRVRASGPKPIRASKTAIIAESGLTVLHQVNYARLPLCQAVLEEVVESVEQFQLRRLDAVASALASADVSVVRWRLLRHAGIDPAAVTHKLAAAIAQHERSAQSRRVDPYYPDRTE